LPHEFDDVGLLGEMLRQLRIEHSRGAALGGQAELETAEPVERATQMVGEPPLHVHAALVELAAHGRNRREEAKTSATGGKPIEARQPFSAPSNRAGRHPELFRSHSARLSAGGPPRADGRQCGDGTRIEQYAMQK
jgi:hypothetical protein